MPQNGAEKLEHRFRVRRQLAEGTPAKGSGRSKVSNGTAFLLGIDGRSPWVRRCKDVIAAHTQDLGGVDNVSSGERSLIRRAAVITTELEMIESRFAAKGDGGSHTELGLYFSGANNLRRLLETVGLRRRSRDVTPSLAEYLDNEATKQPVQVDATEVED